MTQTSRKILKSLFRWTVAAAGTWYVLAQLSWHDRALVIPAPQSAPRWAAVVRGDDDSPGIEVKIDNATKLIPRRDVVSEPDVKQVRLNPNGPSVRLLGVDLIDRSRASRLLITGGGGPAGPRWIDAARTNYQVVHPHPRVQVGVRHLLASARHWYLFFSLMIFPLTFIITSLRWHELLKALDIRLAPSRSFVLNMVGAFYNTFMPGSTGGDVLKAYYVARQTHHRTRAVMSVVVDRVIGLLALIILGGAMAAVAAVHLHIPQTAGVAIFAAAVTTATAAALVIFYTPRLRKISGLEWLLARLPMQQRVRSAVETMHLYGRRPGLAAAALLISFPVHAVVITSAMLAGIGFGLHIPLHYYWTVVPVSVLAGSIPISPQGAGVMEYFAILMLSPIRCTVAEAVALTMSIRLVQVFWNLTGGFFVLRGGYHSPTIAQSQQEEVQDLDRNSAAENAAAINLTGQTN